MKLIIDTSHIVPVYKQIMDQITNSIVKGVLLPGAHLPSIRQIAKDLSINPNTVAKSFQNLESLKIIKSAGRKGSFVHQNALDNITTMNEHQLNQVLLNAISASQDLGFESKKIKKIFNHLLNGEMS